MKTMQLSFIGSITGRGIKRGFQSVALHMNSGNELKRHCPIIRNNFVGVKFLNHSQALQPPAAQGFGKTLNSLRSQKTLQEIHVVERGSRSSKITAGLQAGRWAWVPTPDPKKIPLTLTIYPRKCIDADDPQGPLCVDRPARHHYFPTRGVSSSSVSPNTRLITWIVSTCVHTGRRFVGEEKVEGKNVAKNVQSKKRK